MIDLPDGWTVYHRDTAGQPSAHTDHGGPWYFEPKDYNGDVYSPGYPTREAAAEACWDAAIEWEGEEARELGE